MKFDGKEIFGFSVRQEQSARRRVLRETHPGVRGFRNYNLAGVNPDTVLWTVRGRLVAFTMAGLERDIARGYSYMNGRFYTFESSGGIRYPNCELVDYRQAGPIKAGYVQVALLNNSNALAFTCEVTATIEQATP